MAKKRFRVKAEGAVVLGHTTGEEIEFPADEPYNVDALVKAEIIEPVKAQQEKEEK